MTFMEHFMRTIDFEIYTDGSCKGNGKENSYGGYGYIILEHDLENIERPLIPIAEDVHLSAQTTNNRMEMMAIIDAVEKAIELAEQYEELVHFNIYTDSAYVYNCYKDKWYLKWQRNGWKTGKNDVKNQDLWEQLIPIFTHPLILLFKVRGHRDCLYNNIVDEKVQRAAEELRKKGENIEKCLG